jgi:hypothetical protein
MNDRAVTGLLASNPEANQAAPLSTRPARRPSTCTDLGSSEPGNFYLAGSIAGFRAGTLQLFQITFAGSKCHTASWMRAGLYAGR